jgi:hypothetical protein
MDHHQFGDIINNLFQVMCDLILLLFKKKEKERNRSTYSGQRELFQGE